MQRDFSLAKAQSSQRNHCVNLYPTQEPKNTVGWVSASVTQRFFATCEEDCWVTLALTQPTISVILELVPMLCVGMHTFV